jgi:DNA anti-recombination protein RmuC
MAEIENQNHSHSLSPVVIGALVVAILAALGGLVWSYTLSGRLATQEQTAKSLGDENTQLKGELRETNARLKVASETLGESVGMTQRQMEAKAQAILTQEASDTSKLATAQQKNEKQIGAVSSEVSSVKTDVGGVKTDVAKTQSDLQGAISQMQSMQGDLGIHSGLIARNHDELEILKHKGDRNYYEFTLAKGQKKPVSTVTLELKKADPKKSKFTLDVYADDKKIEKKDKNLNEPVQFYTGKDRLLYELVVNSVDSKKGITGYISTPKNAPVPATIP